MARWPIWIPWFVHWLQDWHVSHSVTLHCGSAFSEETNPQNAHFMHLQSIPYPFVAIILCGFSRILCDWFCTSGSCTTLWFPEIGVTPKYPKSSILIGFSLTKTNHVGIPHGNHHINLQMPRGNRKVQHLWDLHGQVFHFLPATGKPMWKRQSIPSGNLTWLLKMVLYSWSTE